MRFPNMKNGDFPHIDSVNVNQYVNDFDYSRYDYTQMNITICAVPWDMGEAHVGNRTISGIGNVVYFESKENRDSWFAAIPDSECYRFETKYKELHRDKYIDVPLPFDIASKYNYLIAEYSMFANDNSPVMYEDETGHRKWFWFIREVEFLAPNTTRLYLLEDAFQTWIYDVTVSAMMLERGHAPMFETSVSQYLKDPINTSANMLAEDVNFGTVDIAKTSHEIVFNEKDMYAIVVTSADPQGTWGSKTNNDWCTPAMLYANSNIQGIPAYYVFAVAVANFASFMTNIKTSVPQFMQTVKCIAFVSSNLITLSSTTFTFASTPCYTVNANYKENKIFDSFSKSDFGYPEKYADIAKLYTYPYAYIVATDENGAESVIRIENTDGHLSLQTTVSLVFPWLNIAGHIEGVGKTAGKTITFTNVTQRNMPISGNWYEYLMNWDIPTFGVYQDGSVNNDYATHYDRKQQQTSIDNQYLNVEENADVITDNASLTTSANSASTAVSNSSLALDNGAQVTYNSDVCRYDNNTTDGSATATTQAQEQQATIAAAAGVASGVAGAIGAAATGNVAGAVGSLVGAAIGGASTMASSNVAIALTNTQASNTTSNNALHASAANDLNNAKTSNARSAQSDIADIHNDLTEGTAANSSAAMIANGTRDKATGESAIANQIAQASINAPVEFGAYNAGDNAATRPIGLFANIVTQTDAAISAAGDQMLRYGYMLNKYWEFNGNWNVGKYFTYWKVTDFWVTNLNVPDMYMDRLRFFLMGGVTIWRHPEDIGNVTIYDNI